MLAKFCLPLCLEYSSKQRSLVKVCGLWGVEGFIGFARASLLRLQSMRITSE